MPSDRIICPACHVKLKFTGTPPKRVTCPKCQHTFGPGSASVAPSAPAAAPRLPTPLAPAASSSGPRRRKKKNAATKSKPVWLYAGGGVLFVTVLALIGVIAFRGRHAAEGSAPAGDAIALDDVGAVAAAVSPGRAQPASRQPDERPKGIAVSRDGTTAAASYKEGTILVWDPGTGKSIGGWQNSFEADIALSPDGKRLALGATRSDVIRLMNPRTGEFLSDSVHNPTGPTRYRNLAFSADGNFLFFFPLGIFVGQLDVDILDGVKGVKQRRIEVYTGNKARGIVGFAPLPDGAACITLTSIDRSVELQWWNLQSGSLDRKVSVSKGDVEYQAMAVSGDGKTAALLASDPKFRRQPFIELRSLPSGDLIGSLQNVLTMNPINNSIDFSSAHLGFTKEGKTLTTLMGTRLAEWDVATHTKLREQQWGSGRGPDDAALPVISTAANRLIYLGPRMELLFFDLATWKNVVPPG
jgi:hypothetical protein